MALTALGYLAHRVRDANFANEGGEEHANHARPQDVALVASVGPEHPDDAMGCSKDDLVERLVGERSRRSLNSKLVIMSMTASLRRRWISVAGVVMRRLA